jgi:hypothetical protein
MQIRKGVKEIWRKKNRADGQYTRCKAGRKAKRRRVPVPTEAPANPVPSIAEVLYVVAQQVLQLRKTLGVL